MKNPGFTINVSNFLILQIHVFGIRICVPTHKSGLTPCITCISIEYIEDYRSRHMLVQTSSSPVKFISTNIYQNISNSCDLVRLSSTEMKNSEY